MLQELHSLSARRLSKAIQAADKCSYSWLALLGLQMYCSWGGLVGFEGCSLWKQYHSHLICHHHLAMFGNQRWHDAWSNLSWSVWKDLLRLILSPSVVFHRINLVLFHVQSWILLQARVMHISGRFSFEWISHWSWLPQICHLSLQLLMLQDLKILVYFERRLSWRYQKGL